ncbi:MAG: hypothetical protein EOO37_03295, partial [Cytophagaceae bacterium]
GRWRPHLPDYVLNDFQGDGIGHSRNYLVHDFGLHAPVEQLKNDIGHLLPVAPQLAQRHGLLHALDEQKWRLRLLGQQLVAADKAQVMPILLDRGVKPEIVNQVITTVADTIALKVIEDVIREMGTPPAKFVFIVLGSEGRQEQTLLTDQDNAIIYEDKANEHREEVREYFLRFAEQVSDRLNEIGFSFCDGGFMAKNPKWTHSVSHWKRNYQEWLHESNPENVMRFAAFFDVRFLYGEADILDELREFLDLELQKPLDRFLHYMAMNALQYEPPLTFFNNIRTFAVGDQQVINLKKIMSPIVDLVRVFSLKHRIFATNTGQRLADLRKLGVFTEKDYQELLQSYYYLMGMRLKKQSVQMMQDKLPPDNYLDPKKLTKVERVTLKEIFKVISDFQLKIKVSFAKQL